MVFYSEFSSDNNIDDFKEIFNNSKVVKIHTNFSSMDEVDNYFRLLAQKLGVPIIYEEDPISGKIEPNKWTEIKYEKAKEFDTYKHSNKFQPLHTDYGYFSFEIYTSFFYCISQAKFGGATTFIDAETVVDILKDSDKELFDLLVKTPIHFGRKDNPLTNFTDCILSKSDTGWRINWNYYRALSDKNNILLVERFKYFLDNNIEKSGELLALKLKPSEGVFFKDRMVLHGRNSFIGERQLNKGGIALNIPNEIFQYIK